MNNGLPTGWAASPIGDIVEAKYGKGLTERNRLKGSVPVFGSNGLVGTHNMPLTKGPTIVIGRKGSIGAVHYCPEPCWPIDTTYFIDEFPDIDPEYLAHALRSLRLSDLDTSTAVPGLNRDDLYAQEVPLPPLNEQKRIVAGLQKLLPQVSGVSERLNRVEVILKRFRQAVLAAACSGRLTEDWREQNPDAGFSPTEIKSALNGMMEGAEEFPDNWQVVRLGTLTALVTSGSRGWAKFYSDSGSTFIRAQNINSDALSLEDRTFVKLPAQGEGLRTRVQQHDLLVTITGANVTKSALVDKPIENAYVSQHVALVRLSDVRISKFLFYFTISPAHGRKQLLAAAYGQGKPGLNLDNIRKMVIGLPPLAEQREIIRRVESLLTLANQIEARCAQARTHADSLTQSILAKAFRGELLAANNQCRVS